MMEPLRVALVVVGSRGDVQPLLALGAGLRARGHRVRLATHADFRGLAEEAGLAFRPLPGSPRQLFETPELIKSLRKSPSVFRMARTMPRATAEQSAGVLAQLQPYLDAAVADVDLVVTTVASRDAYLAVPPSVPWCFVSWYPHTPTAAFPAMGASRLPLGGWYNRLSHRLVERIEWRVSRPAVNAYRARHGLPPLGRAAPFAALERGRPFFYLHSPAVLPQPADWPDWYHLTGYWFWDRDWQPPAALVELLDRQPPPVVLTFGSLWPACLPGTLGLVAEVVQRAGRRLVVVDGPTEDLPDGVLRLHDVDYDWLFPRCAAVIHHGGFGTGAAVLRAGVPQVVAPVFIDHPFWAARMAELGVAPAPVPAAKLTGRRLSAALRRALGDERMRERAAGLAAAVARDRGVDRACEILERWVAGELPYPPAAPRPARLAVR